MTSSAQTCSSVIICEIIVHLLVIVQNNKGCMIQGIKIKWNKFNINLSEGLSDSPISVASCLQAAGPNSQTPRMLSQYIWQLSRAMIPSSTSAKPPSAPPESSSYFASAIWRASVRDGLSCIRNGSKCCGSVIKYWPIYEKKVCDMYIEMNSYRQRLSFLPDWWQIFPQAYPKC